MSAEVAERPPTSRLPIGVFGVLYYVSISVLLTLFNKALFQSHSVPPVLVLLSQSATTLIVLKVLACFGLKTSADVRRISGAQACTHLPLLVCYISMLMFSMAALKSTSLLMYHSLRRSSIIPVIALQWHFERRAPTKATVLAAALIVGGGSAAIITNLRWEAEAYLLAFAANLTTAYYLTRLRHVRDVLGVSNLQLLYLNNVYAFPLLFACCLATPLPKDIHASFQDPRFLVIFVCSSLFAIVLNHAVYVNTTVNSATTHTVSCQLKDAILFICSVLFVDNPKYRSRGMVVGALVEFVGSLVYAGGKIRASTNNPDEKPTASSDAGSETEKECLVENEDDKK